MIYLSGEERRVIAVAADRAALRPGAYIAATAVRTARDDVAPARSEDAAVRPAAIGITRESIAELRDLRRLMGNVAGNLNDVARHANSTGEVAEQTAAVLDFVRRATLRLETLIIAQSRTLS